MKQNKLQETIEGVYKLEVWREDGNVWVSFDTHTFPLEIALDFWSDFDRVIFTIQCLVQMLDEID